MIPLPERQKVTMSILLDTVPELDGQTDRQTHGHMDRALKLIQQCCAIRKQDTLLLPIIMENINRFSKFFHYRIQQ